MRWKRNVCCLPLWPSICRKVQAPDCLGSQNNTDLQAAGLFVESHMVSTVYYIKAIFQAIKCINHLTWKAHDVGYISMNLFFFLLLFLYGESYDVFYCLYSHRQSLYQVASYLHKVEFFSTFLHHWAHSHLDCNSCCLLFSQKSQNHIENEYAVARPSLQVSLCEGSLRLII